MDQNLDRDRQNRVFFYPDVARWSEADADTAPEDPIASSCKWLLHIARGPSGGFFILGGAVLFRRVARSDGLGKFVKRGECFGARIPLAENRA
ncbi:MAG: hypothetical protein U1E27_14245, partial [Kiritimatiellia bacterium]|nr:hypothetical protein [Kiritimatiellia bacterium]